MHRRTNGSRSSPHHNVLECDNKKGVWSLASGTRAKVIHTAPIRAVASFMIGCTVVVVTMLWVAAPWSGDEVRVVATIGENLASVSGGGSSFQERPAAIIAEVNDGERKRSAFVTSRLGRFPQHGTPEFDKQCGWTNSLPERDCTFFIQPVKNGQEGLAWFVNEIAKGFILAKQAGCDLRFTYGDKVKLHEVIAPYDRHNWTVPSGFECGRGCLVAWSFSHTIESVLGKQPKISPVPQYRFAYYGGNDEITEEQFRHIEQNLDGFHLETGMACALGSLFRLVPTASKFEPRLFTTILPTLRDPNSLVMSLYVRTGRTDQIATVEENGRESKYVIKSLPIAKEVVDCALQLEGEYLSGKRSDQPPFSRVVWMLITDAPDVKQWVMEEYHGQDATKSATSLPHARGSSNSLRSERTVRREVLVTSSRGVHTRSRRDPTTADFAEGLIDWYLLGESDLVVNAGRYTYGATGALRTARPFFIKDCQQGVLVRDYS